MTFLATGLFLQSPTITFAQNYPTADQYLPVATLNRDRLFAESQFGKSFNAQFQRDTNALAEENRRIEKELADEEIELTEKRKQLSNTEFRKIADAFNDKVETIRRDRAQKLNDLNTSRIQAQRTFLANVTQIIIELMEDRGIQFILNDDAIFMSASAGDITDSVIESVDKVLGPDAPISPK